MKAIIDDTLTLTAHAPKDGHSGNFIGSAEGTSFTSDRHFPKKILLAVLLTACAFGWTAWSLIHSTHSYTSIAVATGLMLLCLAAWAVLMRSLFNCRPSFQESAKTAEAIESLTRERNLLRTVIDNLPDLIYAKDTEGHFVLNNLAHAKSFGVHSAQELVGKSDFDFYPQELANQFYADEKKIVETGQPVINQEQYKSKGTDRIQNKHWSSSTKVLWQDESGDVLGTVGITRDIHEMKLAQEGLRNSEEKLRQFTAQLERSNRELQDFAYVASHDLQEPLRKIIVFSERLKEKNIEALGTDARDYLERMQKAALRMQNLINDLLTFSRVTSKANPFAPVDLAEIARDVVCDLEGRIEQVKGRVEIKTLPVIDAEKLQIRQLLQNLIGNALKFRRPEETPLVTVQAEMISGFLSQSDPRASAQQLCRLTVSDNGIGFDEKYLDRIFNVFQRLHTRNEYEGTGMGLAIARKIVLYHGGDITAKSKPGSGTTFIVTLPIAQPKNQDAPNP